MWQRKPREEPDHRLHEHGPHSSLAMLETDR